MVAAMRRPDQLARLRSDPEALAATAVEEFLRFDAPLHLFERTATTDTPVGSIVVEQGQKIAALLGSANRDPLVFDAPSAMDVTRDPNPHLGFGAGIHFCLGAPLARVELQTSLPVLLQRFPGLDLAAEPVLRPTFVLRGYESVPVAAEKETSRSPQ
jgi:cytochrome P450